MSAADSVRPQGGDERARLLAGYGPWDTPSLVAELAADERMLSSPGLISREAREHTALRAGVLREILARRTGDEMTAGP